MQTPYRENLSEDEKVAGLVRFWSEAKYNFVWFDKLIDFDWDAKMIEFMPRVRATKSTGEYYRVLMEFAALSLVLVEGRVLVSGVHGDEALKAAGAKRGSELVSVQGLLVRDYAAKFIFAAGRRLDRPGPGPPRPDFRFARRESGFRCAAWVPRRNGAGVRCDREAPAPGGLAETQHAAADASVRIPDAGRRARGLHGTQYF